MSPSSHLKLKKIDSVAQNRLSSIKYKIQKNTVKLQSLLSQVKSNEQVCQSLFGTQPKLLNLVKTKKRDIKPKIEFSYCSEDLDSLVSIETNKHQ